MKGVALEEILRSRLTGPGLTEDSTKLRAGRVEAGRQLWSFSRRVLYPGPKTRFARLCTALFEADAPVAAALAPHLSQARSLHVAQEPAGAKLYLEFGPRSAPEPGLAFLAAKPGASGVQQARYRHLDPDAAERALAELLEAPAQLERARRYVSIARRCGGQLLEVTDDSARRSVDLNLADAELTVETLPGLIELLADFGLARAELPVPDGTRLGHVALGRDDRGHPFVTLYHGAREWR